MRRHRPNRMQAVILAGQLMAKEYTCADAVPFEIWRSLGFLNVPSQDLIACINEFLPDGQDRSGGPLTPGT